MFITDDKLPDDVVRRHYAETKHALCCLNCGFEYGFDPTQPGSIGKPLWVLLVSRGTQIPESRTPSP
jgi:hypothetical protein